MTIDLGAGRHLVLAGGGRAAWWLAVGVVALMLLLILYRYERKLVPRGTGLTLLGMRLLAALALVAALFEPIAARSYRETVKGRVILGVDLSESMATADPAPAPEDRRASPADPPPTVSRREVARRLLEGDWMKAIAADHGVEAVGFARDPVPGTPETLARALKAPSRPDEPASLVTDWSPALDLALRGGDSAPVVGVVLLTDGRQNAPGDPGRGADRLAARGVPVFPVLIGSTAPPKDVAIASVRAPDSVYMGDAASVEVAVKADGIPGVEVPVSLERPGAPPLKQMVRGQPDGARAVVTFRVPMESAGPQGLTLSVGPLFGDARPDNDRRAVTVQVADDKARVLLVEGEARWEFRYLRNALARDPRVSVEAVVFRQPKSGPGSATYKDALPPGAGAGAGTSKVDPLGAFDAILVGDVEPGVMPADAWARLDAFVADRGGTLVLSPGPRGWPILMTNEAVRRLLPVIDPRPAPFDPTAPDPSRPSLPPGAAIWPSPSASAESWPMLQLAADAEKSRSVWSGLPRLPWALAGKAKPGATVLASLVGSGPGSEGAVLAAQPYGLGKVLWVGTDATWRWRHRVGDAYHHRFWGQVVRWAASGKLAAGNALIRFGPDRPKLPEGDGPRLSARFADGLSGVGPDLLLVARIFKAAPPARGRPTSPKIEGEAVAVVPLRPVPGQPRAFAATAPALPSGSYLIRLDVPQLAEAWKTDGGPPPEATLEVVPRTTSELVELSAARDPLDRLASATGGRVFTPADADRLPPLLRSRTLVKTRTEETNLWDTPWALGLFFSVLTVEWALRKRAGLP